MPERSRLDRWRFLGRLLPRDVRERVFEPALADSMRGWIRGGTEDPRVPFALHAFGTWLGCLPPSALGIFVRKGHLTRFGRASVLTAAVVVLAILVIRATASYPPVGP